MVMVAVLGLPRATTGGLGESDKVQVNVSSVSLRSSSRVAMVTGTGAVDPAGNVTTRFGGRFIKSSPAVGRRGGGRGSKLIQAMLFHSFSPGNLADTSYLVAKYYTEIYFTWCHLILTCGSNSLAIYKFINIHRESLSLQDHQKCYWVSFIHIVSVC